MHRLDREIFTAVSRCRVKCRSGPIFTRIFSNFSGAVPISGPLLISEPLGFFWPFLQADRSAYSELKSRAVRQTFYLIIQFKFPRFLEVLSNFSFSCNFGLDFFSRFFMSAIHFNSNFRISYGEVLPNFSCDLGLDFFQVFYTSAIHFTSNFLWGSSVQFFM